MKSDCFLSCDWGTSHLRLRLVHASRYEVLGEIRSNEGVGRMAAVSTSRVRAEVFRTTLARSMARLSQQSSHVTAQCPIVISGMASSSLGWCELPYAPLPFALDGRDMIWKDVGPLSVNGNSHRVILLSGVRGEWEIMRGEETQVLGLTRLGLGQALEHEAVIILPGTHSKHVHLKAGRVIEFQTYLTGELFDVLSQHSVLRHSVQSPDQGALPTGNLSGAARQALQEGVEAIRSGPLLELLFRVRTRHVLHGRVPEENKALLNGLLIGAEMAGLIGRYPGSVPLVLCGGEIFADMYETASETLGLRERLKTVSSLDVERLSTLGQAVVLKHILSARN